METLIENKCIDLNSVIEAHLNYLSEITEKGFLSGTKEIALSGRLNDIFDSILRYKVALDHLHDYATSESTKQIYGKAGSSDKIDLIRRHLQEKEDDFTIQVLEFLKIINSYHDEDLRSLSTRLDYNAYYSSFQITSRSP